MKQLFKRIIKSARFITAGSNMTNSNPQETPDQKPGALNSYVLSKPSNQNVVDIFQGEWSSQLPDELNASTTPGQALLFSDPRIAWAEEVFNCFADWRILELGPLEAGHSYMFQSRNAREVISIEANTRAFLKCLCIKEMLKLDKVTIKLGDFVSFLKEDSSEYSMVCASGVLYHMEKPVELLELISKVSRRVFIWTHYYDESVISKIDRFSHKFSSVTSFEHNGVSYEGSVQSYKNALNWQGFCGGPKVTSKWLTRDSIIKALRQFGFTDIHIGFDQPDHVNGPAFAICASK